MSQNKTESKPEIVELPREEGLSSSALFAALTAYMEDAENKYHNEQCFGDAISTASWRATYLTARDCIRICRKHLPANAKELAPPLRSSAETEIKS